jgi:hypothetical protein
VPKDVVMQRPWAPAHQPNGCKLLQMNRGAEWTPAALPTLRKEATSSAADRDSPSSML